MKSSQYFLDQHKNIFFDDHEIQQSYTQFNVKITPVVPYVNVIEKRRIIEVHILVPSIKLEHIEIQINGERIVISSVGIRSNDFENYLVQEFTIPAFIRSIPLPKGISKKNVKKRIRNGVLTLQFKKLNCAYE